MWGKQRKELTEERPILHENLFVDKKDVGDYKKIKGQ